MRHHGRRRIIDIDVRLRGYDGRQDDADRNDQQETTNYRVNHSAHNASHDFRDMNVDAAIRVRRNRQTTEIRSDSKTS